MSASEAGTSGTENFGNGRLGGRWFPAAAPEGSNQQNGQAVSRHRVPPWLAGYPPNSIPWASGRSFDQLMVFV